MLDFESQVVLFTFVRPDELHNYTGVEAKQNKTTCYGTFRIWERTAWVPIDLWVWAYPLKHSVGNNVVRIYQLSEDLGFSNFKDLSVSVQLTKRVVVLWKEADFLSVWKVISFCHGVVISGWLDGFIDFQRNFRFGSKLPDKIVDLRKKADFFQCPLFYVL